MVAWVTLSGGRLLFVDIILVPLPRLAQSVERKALNLVVVGSSPTVGVIYDALRGFNPIQASGATASVSVISISGLVVEYIVAIDVTRVRFPADAFSAVP